MGRLLSPCQYEASLAWKRQSNTTNLGNENVAELFLDICL